MTIGTYDYSFMVRSFDDDGDGDSTPDTVRFIGNYPPVIDEIQIGYDEDPLIPEIHFVPISGDTLYIGLDKLFQPRPDTASAYAVDFDPGELMYTYYYRIMLRANGHDDRRDPPGSGIKGWMYSIEGSEEYDFGGENEWVYDDPVDEFDGELLFRVVVPWDEGTGRPDYSIIENPPGFLGDQELTIIAVDMNTNERFVESIRAISPEFDPDDPCKMIKPGSSIINMLSPYRNARFDTSVRNFYIKLVR
jgi:hypothetical protein